MFVVKLAAVLKARRGDIRSDMLRVERQILLQPEDGVEQNEVDHAQQQQRHDVVLPAHLARRIDAADGVDSVLDGGEEADLALQDAGDIEAERNGSAEHEDEDEGDVCPTGDCHDEYPCRGSEVFGTQQRPYEIGEQQGGDAATENEVDHGSDFPAEGDEADESREDRRGVGE